MQENLRYGGNTILYDKPQTDNCLFERNCLSGDPDCTGNGGFYQWDELMPVSYTHLRAHETVLDLVCRLLLEKKKKETEKRNSEIEKRTIYDIVKINNNTKATYRQIYINNIEHI